MEFVEKTDVRCIQNRLLEMGKIIAQILEKYDIPYMLAYGTLLGAVRHKGFIPWDDDFDFYLFEDTYDIAINYLRKELPVTMFLEDTYSEPLYFHSWAHVKDLQSRAYNKAFPQDNIYKHKGISIDLYKTKRILECELWEYINEENRSYIERRKDNGLIDDNEYKRRILNLKKDEEKVKLEANKSKDLIFAMISPYKCKKMKVNNVFPLKKYEFEDTEFFGPNNADAILHDIYGDYMQFPPIEKRKSHYSSVEFL